MHLNAFNKQKEYVTGVMAVYDLHVTSVKINKIKFARGLYAIKFRTIQLVTCDMSVTGKFLSEGEFRFYCP